MLDANASVYSCGADIDLQGYDALSANARPYVRLKLDWSTHMEVQLYSSGVFECAVTDTNCGYCGEDGRRAEPDTETASLLPICEACSTQYGGKARGVPGGTRFRPWWVASRAAATGAAAR